MRFQNPRFSDLKLDAQDRAALVRFAQAWVDHPKPVLFAGAGLTSFNTKAKPGSPGKRALAWNDLAKVWTAELEQHGIKEPPTDPLRLAQLYEQACSRSSLLDTLEAGVPEADLEAGDAYAEIAAVPWGAVITTNYDSMLEGAFGAARTTVLPIVADEDLTRRRQPETTLLVKMHGDFSHRELIVIAEDDYGAYRRTRPALAAKIDQLLLEHPVLFVGFSLSDPNVGRILNWVRSTVGALQLPSVSIVHSAPTRPESELWAARGIRLVHCRRDLGLADLIGALNRERESPEPHQAIEPQVDVRAIAQELQHAASSRTVGWEPRASRLLRQLLELGRGETRDSVASALRGLRTTDWRELVVPVHGALPYMIICDHTRSGIDTRIAA